ncbi:MAG: response regulator, partial [bacterium]|nr:response regulator [bacterium]
MKKRILIVDDSDAIRFSLKDILSTDYKVETAADGEIALEKLKVFSPDLVLLDVDMPVLDGLETCRRIRMDEKFKFVKILMLSGKINIADRLTGYEIGADDYLRKPFDKGELLSKIRVFLRLKYLEEVDRLKKSLLDLMGHEINTPLNGIIAPAYTLMHDESLKMEDVKELAVSIYDSARWFHNNFKKSMLLVKLKSGRKLTITNESVREYLDVAMSKLHPRIEEKQLALKSKIDPNLEWRGDWVLLSQTLRYIIDNAIKFSHAKGEINIIATH